MPNTSFHQHLSIPTHHINTSTPSHSSYPTSPVQYISVFVLASVFATLFVFSSPHTSGDHHPDSMKQHRQKPPSAFKLLLPFLSTFPSVSSSLQRLPYRSYVLSNNHSKINSHLAATGPSTPATPHETHMPWAHINLSICLSNNTISNTTTIRGYLIPSYYKTSYKAKDGNTTATSSRLEPPPPSLTMRLTQCLFIYAMPGVRGGQSRSRLRKSEVMEVMKIMEVMEVMEVVEVVKIIEVVESRESGFNIEETSSR
ncbi:hypothetical protein NEUTE1DRAFT_106824 [Neurospora tetrasperma FGSC 2508]|uniref:Uncharacterized protein n=1 Tax=Neurospora tetrasperma (strain FGSC 2508 / ATCC MYA-4615 / P0657) TaxID=510951 RepID=F8MAV1_NEUT8|nr:uncharacterized protein NEUTE1DRAFT_106824 [Neurospora tetrasperma FGSC 2508]EGO60169.1 hypothetical protein NEUTE1DRAFT_106824 [Neurospora tetrasperma FGSC 2508]EGZ75874.1 hypothetical protein NEUTE2DRAFT_55537 [Neurospora tetrasperma FGSC 2509]